MPVIFISRGTISGAHMLVDSIREKTGIRSISHEDLVKTVNQYGEIASRILEKLDNATIAYDQFCDLRRPYLVLMRKALLEQINHEDLIYHGYSGHLLLPPVRHFVRVRIGAPISLRVSMTMERLGCDEEAARDYITKADEQRGRWARFVYAQDIKNPLLYDVYLNLNHMTLKAASGILECILRQEDFQATPESLTQVERIRLATDIEEALVVDPRTAEFEINAEVADAGIHLVGPYLDDHDRSTVLNVAQSVPGVDNIEYSPGYKSRFEENCYF
jgi:cytidylate kinase